MRHAYSRSYNLVPIGLSLSWTSTSMSLTYKLPIAHGTHGYAPIGSAGE
ncbi:MAG: hypothetical protein OJF51_005125 [Nitrospira sp.]|nr:MAG: hypothetical protein OJF51_005125 [Nitrospira sp.]